MLKPYFLKLTQTELQKTIEKYLISDVPQAKIEEVLKEEMGVQFVRTPVKSKIRIEQDAKQSTAAHNLLELINKEAKELEETRDKERRLPWEKSKPLF